MRLNPRKQEKLEINSQLSGNPHNKQFVLFLLLKVVCLIGLLFYVLIREHDGENVNMKAFFKFCFILQNYMSAGV